MMMPGRSVPSTSPRTKGSQLDTVMHTPLVHFVEYGTGNCIMSRVNWKSTLLTDMFLLLLQIS